MTGIGLPALSQHLAELRRTALVVSRLEARPILYRIADDDTAERVGVLFAAFDSGPPIGRAAGRVSTRPSAVQNPTGAAMFARIG